MKRPSHAKSISAFDIRPIEKHTPSEYCLEPNRSVSPLNLKFSGASSSIKDLAGNAMQTFSKLMRETAGKASFRSYSNLTSRRGTATYRATSPEAEPMQAAVGRSNIKGLSLRAKVKLLQDIGFTNLVRSSTDLVDFEANRDCMPRVRLSSVDFMSTKTLNAFLKQNDLEAALKVIKRRACIEHVRAASHQSLPNKPYIMDMNTKRRTIKQSANYFRPPDTYDTIALKQTTGPLTELKPNRPTLKLHKIMKDCDALYTKTQGLQTAIDAMTDQAKKHTRNMTHGTLSQLELRRAKRLMKVLA